MEYIFWYFIGWIIFSICYYTFKKIIDDYENNKILIYDSIIRGFFSWGGVIFGLTLLVTGLIMCCCIKVDNYIRTKLSD